MQRIAMLQLTSLKCSIFVSHQQFFLAFFFCVPKLDCFVGGSLHHVV